MSDDGKYVTSCPTCQQKVRIPKDHSGRVKCPSCSFTWQPQTNAATFYVQKPQRKFAMTPGDTIEYGFAMLSTVVLTIIITGAIGWGGFAIIQASVDWNEPLLGFCFGLFLIAFSSVVFTALTYGIGVRVVAEGVMVGNLAADDYRKAEQQFIISNPTGTEENLTIPNPVVADENMQLVSILQNNEVESMVDLPEFNEGI